MINKFRSLLNKVVGISTTDKVECSIDETKVSCDTLSDVFHSPEAQGSWTGIPAPVYAPLDDWFKTPYNEDIKSEKQIQYLQEQEQVKQQKIEEEKKNKEPANIHEVMYKMATKNWTTAKEFQGGSEHYHEGPGGWSSGTGYNQYR